MVVACKFNFVFEVYVRNTFNIKLYVYYVILSKINVLRVENLSIL